MPRRRWPLLLVILAGALLLIGGARQLARHDWAYTRAEREHRRLPIDHASTGTYRILICPRYCTMADSGRAAALGYLVLAATALPVADVPDSARHALEATNIMLQHEGRPNACYVIRKGRVPGAEYAAMNRVGLTHWKAEKDSSVSFALFRSPDAGYGAQIRIAGGRLLGRGSPWGFGYDFRSPPKHVVVGERVGLPDFDRCVSGASS